MNNDKNWDNAELLALGVGLGILGAVLYDLISGAFILFLPTITSWDKVVGGTIAAYFFYWVAKGKRDKRLGKSKATSGT